MSSCRRTAAGSLPASTAKRNATSGHCGTSPLQQQPDDPVSWYNVRGGSVVAGTAYSKEACRKQALQHQPCIATGWYCLGLKGGGLVAGTAYSKEPC